jgi:hypothetical protein
VDPKVTGDEFSRVKDLDRVWNTCDKQFGPKNTLMLESDEVSVHYCHKNSLIIDEFTREDVWPTS